MAVSALTGRLGGGGRQPSTRTEPFRGSSSTKHFEHTLKIISLLQLLSAGAPPSRRSCDAYGAEYPGVIGRALAPDLNILDQIGLNLKLSLPRDSGTWSF